MGKYLFTKVHRAVVKRGYMKPKEFFLTIWWKMEMAGDIIRKNNPNLRGKIITSTKDILDDNSTPTLRDKVRRLLEIRGVGVSLASAILAVCFPERYAELDPRAWRTLYRWSSEGSLNSKWGVIRTEDIPTRREEAIDAYLRYNRTCSRLAHHIFRDLPLEKRVRTLVGALSAYGLEMELRSFLRKVK